MSKGNVSTWAKVASLSINEATATRTLRMHTTYSSHRPATEVNNAKTLNGIHSTIDDIGSSKKLIETVY